MICIARSPADYNRWSDRVKSMATSGGVAMLAGPAHLTPPEVCRPTRASTAYDAKNGIHSALVTAATHAEEVAANVDLPSMSFQAQRRRIREALVEDGVAGQLDQLAAELLASVAD